MMNDVFVKVLEFVFRYVKVGTPFKSEGYVVLTDSDYRFLCSLSSYGVRTNGGNDE